MSSGSPPTADSTPSASKSVLSDSAPELGHPERNDEPPSPVKPKRRRRAAASDEKPVKNQMFYFVDASSSSREKRAHVMRHHVQEKRRQRKHSTAGDNDGHSQRNPWQGKLEYGDSDELHRIQRNSEEIATGNSALLSTGPVPLNPASQTNSPFASPVTMLDASRKDPFDSLPMVLGKDDLELVDYWTNKLTYWSGQNIYMKNAVFRAAMNHPLAFQAVVLTYCARWRAQLYGVKDCPAVQHHLGQTTKGIEDILNGSIHIDEDNFAMALTGMALQEERFGSKETAQRYADKAVQVFRPLSGSNIPVEVFMHYVRYVMIPANPVVDVDGQRWLLTFLRGAEELMAEQSKDIYISTVPQRRESFQMEGPLFPLLSSGPCPSQVPHDSRMYVVPGAPTQEICRTAALIYITAALWDYQDSASKTSRFLAHLSATVKAHSLDRYPAVETLVWLLLEEGHDADLKDPERGWSTGELLKTHKQLRPDLQFYFNEILMSFLMLVPPIRGIDAFEKELQATVG
ncbi:hypothetical protein ASPWEDRAFT_440886 [Aspergillus wentii DTO 134E9]|uniref:Uncharacterized protein n=1 Tax=Aspergillus wentii DTO 134E9 TaxID=1073089 RepID=A0A1L9RQG2_ASPWE|nr:uncharacterized protein ASPWEDRAFT_440886 [Aspergillus wentii DTO 134E9]OJJ37132.1 hypothetical protein ASPWEDRAFT_440886 [Aspergillus wentii DTO 134E9]